MKQELIVHHLEELASKLSISVCYEDLRKSGVSSKGGKCKIKGEEKIIIDKRLTLGDKIDILVKELSQSNLEDIYIPPFIKGLLTKKTTSV